MKNILIFTILFFSTHLLADPVWTSAKPSLVFGGYPDKSIAFMPVGGAVNPASCTSNGVYAIQADHDTNAALSIILAAKMADRTLRFSVRDDICHTIQQVGVTGVTIPVIQRIAID